MITTVSIPLVPNDVQLLIGSDFQRRYLDNQRKHLISSDKSETRIQSVLLDFLDRFYPNILRF